MDATQKVNKCNVCGRVIVVKDGIWTHVSRSLDSDHLPENEEAEHILGPEEFEKLADRIDIQPQLKELGNQEIENALDVLHIPKNKIDALREFLNGIETQRDSRQKAFEDAVRIRDVDQFNPQSRDFTINEISEIKDRRRRVLDMIYGRE